MTWTRAFVPVWLVSALCVAFSQPGSAQAVPANSCVEIVAVKENSVAGRATRTAQPSRLPATGPPSSSSATPDAGGSNPRRIRFVCVIGGWPFCRSFCAVRGNRGTRSRTRAYRSYSRSGHQPVTGKSCRASLRMEWFPARASVHKSTTRCARCPGRTRRAARRRSGESPGTT